MKTSNHLLLHPIRILLSCMILFLAVSLLIVSSYAEPIPETDERGWVDFALLCNEGMKNDGGNSGNTLMIISMNPDTGKIRLLMFTWDTFIDYPGYDVPQRLDMPYRNNGPEETMKVFNDNFNMDIKLFMSLNYLNLASLIDKYDGVTVDVSRAERNALNDMVHSKVETIKSKADLGLLTQFEIDRLQEEYYLTDYGPTTHLNGLQAVGFGWLQYDSVYNCCEREAEVIAALFKSVGIYIKEDVILYTNESGVPADAGSRRMINLDNMTEDDQKFLRAEMAPIFEMAYHNLSEENIRDISNALIRAAYNASRQGVNILSEQFLETKVLPLEAKDPYDLVAGSKGHLVDKEKNEAEIKAFLFAED